MRAAARLTGLSPHVMRIWERRYGAVVPERSETDRRLYSQADIERLNLLRRATEAGHGIGQIATLPATELAVLVQHGEPAAIPAGQGGRTHQPGQLDAEAYVEECYAAVQSMDATALEVALGGAMVQLGQIAALQNVVTPLMYRIGEAWRRGEARVSQEHMAAAAVRRFLGNIRYGSHGETAPLMIVATPTGQVHELGALMVAATADSEGWRVLYLGASLPAEELAAAAQRSGARAVALSIVYPADDPRLLDELALLRHHLPDTTTVVVGGRGSNSLRPSLEALRIAQMPDIAALRDFLAAQRLIPE